MGNSHKFAKEYARPLTHIAVEIWRVSGAHNKGMVEQRDTPDSLIHSTIALTLMVCIYVSSRGGMSARLIYSTPIS